MQQGDESQQLVACASPQVLSGQAASTELLRQVTLGLGLLSAGGFMSSQASPWHWEYPEDKNQPGRWAQVLL